MQCKDALCNICYYVPRKNFYGYIRTLKKTEMQKLVTMWLMWHSLQLKTTFPEDSKLFSLILWKVLRADLLYKMFGFMVLYVVKGVDGKELFCRKCRGEKLDPWMIAQLLFSGKLVSPSQLLLATSLSLTFFQESVWDERNFQISMVHSISFKIGVQCFILVLEYSNCPAPKKKILLKFFSQRLVVVWSDLSHI